MTAEPRARLAARQAELISALYGGSPAEGLDARLVTLTSDSLARKRARAVARAWPALARALGPGLADQFTAFARVTPPPEGGALADGLAFSQVIARERRLPDDARIEGMLATSRVKLRRNRLVTRRGPRLAAAMTGRPRRLVVIATLPPIGTGIATLGPLTRPRRSQPGTRPR
jgi:hypothetical protein